MRDPDGRLHFTASEARRTLNGPLDAAHFLRSDAATALVADRMLVDYVLPDELSVVSVRRPFVTQPTEWPDSQLHDAAMLTLQIAQRAADAGFDLKDASAWNVIAEGTVGVFCDLLSFEPLHLRPWWAAGQFARHFVTPLWLSRRRGVAAHCWLALWRDGVPASSARRLLGPSRFLSRCWPLVAGAPVDSALVRARSEPRLHDVQAHRARLLASMTWMLGGVRPPRDVVASGAVDWSRYVDERSHYGAASLAAKRSQIAAWLSQLPCAWVADCGCNTGEFTEIALAAGANVVALDADHAAIESLYRRYRGRRDVFPVSAALDDLTAGRGWAGCEWPGLPVRMAARFDGVLMLALLHHLAVGAAVRLEDIAAFARHCSRDWLIVEWLGQQDPQLQALCRQRRRDPLDFTVDRQRDAFCGAGFTLAAEVTLPDCDRHLALLRRTP